MIIPWQQLAPDTLTNLLEEYATRDGTDYGLTETALDTKVEQLRRQLASGKILLVYSELHETVNLLPAEQFS